MDASVSDLSKLRTMLDRIGANYSVEGKTLQYLHLTLVRGSEGTDSIVVDFVFEESGQLREVLYPFP